MTLIALSIQQWHSPPDPSERADSVTVLGLPNGIEPEYLPDGCVNAQFEARADIIVLTHPNAEMLISRHLPPSLAATLPVVGMGASISQLSLPRCDLKVCSPTRRALSEILTTLKPVVQRNRRMPPSVKSSQDARVLLMARLYVRERGMTPRRDPGVKSTLVYDDNAVVPGAVSIAEHLVNRGMMERRFLDVSTICPFCASARLLVQERCAHCGSANLVEQAILHHFRCGCQRPEADFRAESGDLICPKCKRRLKQFSYDYDRPGSVYSCRACGQISGDAKVSFSCLDCAAQFGAENVGRSEVHSYHLTRPGRACVESGVLLAGASEPEADLRERIIAFKKRQAELGHPACVLSIRLTEPNGIPRRGHAWQQTHGLFADLIRECFVASTEIVETGSGFALLLAGDTKADVKKALPEIRHRLESHLALAPTVEYDAQDIEEYIASIRANFVHS